MDWDGVVGEKVTWMRHVKEDDARLVAPNNIPKVRLSLDRSLEIKRYSFACCLKIERE
jgi:hypothetical protein